MRIHRLGDPPLPELALALERFEEQFTYPLGPDRVFRISHGADYPRFFRAMGEACCVVAERDGQVLGTLGVAVKTLVAPDVGRRPVVYFGDLKIAPQARGGRVLLTLIDAAREWVGDRAAAAFAVVMDGTEATPMQYSGRLGIPAFVPLAQVGVLRIFTRGQEQYDEALYVTEERGQALFETIVHNQAQFSTSGGNPVERSECEPRWIAVSEQATGRLEDTRLGKRLIAGDGDEMRSAHLSCFAYRRPQHGVKLLRVALRLARARGFPALFVAVQPDHVDEFRHGFADREVVAASATVYGTGLTTKQRWNINPAEI